MTRYPTLNDIYTTRTNTEEWLGYNHNLRIGDGELFDMENMSADRYPVLAPRKARGVYAEPQNASALIAKDNICYVDGSRFVMDGYPIEMGLSAGEKQLVSMGAYVIILPDKKYINTADTTDNGNIEASFTTSGAVTYQLCTQEGEEYTGDIRSPSAPENPADGQLWIDTSSKPHVLNRWSETSAMWVQIATTYIKISKANIGKSFKEFDGVTLSGLKESSNEELKELDGSFVLWGSADDYIIIVGMLSEAVTDSTALTVSRKMPNMDFVIESNNRLWGCRYGTNAAGDVVNEIYASKQGDFRNWSVFLGIATDSYIASVGTDGQFTGAVNHLGYPLFFKENCVHKVYGAYPSAYQIQTTNLRGVQKGSSRSLATVNEVLYYKTRTGVVAYDGSLPSEISYALGDIHYKNAVGGSHAGKYYISMQDDDDNWHLFVFDVAKKLWHREDSTHVLDWASARNELYFIDAVDGKIKTVLGSGNLKEDAVQWMAQTGPIGTETPDTKSICRLDLRMSMDVGASMKIYIDYDSEDNWTEVCTLDCTVLKTFSIPIRPRRCDHLRLRLTGTGDVRIFSKVTTFAYGSSPNDHSGEVLDF